MRGEGTGPLSAAKTLQPSIGTEDSRGVMIGVMATRELMAGEGAKACPCVRGRVLYASNGTEGVIEPGAIEPGVIEPGAIEPRASGGTDAPRVVRVMVARELIHGDIARELMDGEGATTLAAERESALHASACTPVAIGVMVARELMEGEVIKTCPGVRERALPESIGTKGVIDAGGRAGGVLDRRGGLEDWAREENRCWVKF